MGDGKERSEPVGQPGVVGHGASLQSHSLLHCRGLLLFGKVGLSAGQFSVFSQKSGFLCETFPFWGGGGLYCIADRILVP